MTARKRTTICAALLVLLISLSVNAQKPELYVRTGHTEMVSGFAFSPDGKILASGGHDKVIKLWDVGSGQELRTLTGHLGLITTVAFSPDGRLIASVGETARLWDVATGRELRTLHKVSNLSWAPEFNGVAFSPDGKTVAAGYYNYIRMWDVATGRELRTLKGHSGGVYSVAFSPDGKMLASSAPLDEMIRLWDVATGEMRSLERGKISEGGAVAFSPDGKTLASGGVLIMLWDVATGRMIHYLEERARDVAFSPDGKVLASSKNLIYGKEVSLWDVATGQRLRTIEGVRLGGYGFVSFSPDGKLLATADQEIIRIWDAASGEELRQLQKHTLAVHNVTFSPDGKMLAVAGMDNKIELWELATGRGLRTLRGSLISVFSPDGKVLAGVDGAFIKLWDVMTGQELRSLPQDGGFFRPSGTFLAISPDGKVLANTKIGDDKKVQLWDMATGRELRTLSSDSAVNFIAFSPDSKLLAGVGAREPKIHLWDVVTGRDLHTLTGNFKGVFSIAFDRVGKTLASGALDGTIRLWDVATAKELQTLAAHDETVLTLAFSPDGKTLASGGFDNSIRLWDAATGQKLQTLAGHSGYVSSVAFSPDGKTLASGSGDGTSKLWDLAAGKELASLVRLGEERWTVITPDGLFDGSPDAWQRIAWRFSPNLYDLLPLEAFFSDFYHPNLLNDIYSGKRPRASASISQKDRRQPQLKLTMPDGQTPLTKITTRDVKVSIEIREAPAGAQDVRLFRNGSLVNLWRGDVLKGQNRAILEATIPLIAGENRLTAYAFNRDNIKSADATLSIIGAEGLKRKGIAYVLAIGVNSYANPQYNLRYSVADAEAFSEEWKRQQDRLGNYERVEIIPLYDRRATKADILRALEELARKAQPEDAAVIYFAGHGTAQQARFYLVPHDLGYRGPREKLATAGLQSLLKHSISDLELERATEGIDAGQLLLVIDACNSGQALESEETRRGPMNSKGLAQLAYEKGMYILTAAQSYQEAQESSLLGHGLLTYALVIDGLRGAKADAAPKDGQVTGREWLDYATTRVPQMQEERMQRRAQRRQGRRPEEEANLQRPRAFYRRELESQPLIVAKTASVLPVK